MSQLDLGIAACWRVWYAARGEDGAVRAFIRDVDVEEMTRLQDNRSGERRLVLCAEATPEHPNPKARRSCPATCGPAEPCRECHNRARRTWVDLDPVVASICEALRATERALARARRNVDLGVSPNDAEGR